MKIHKYILEITVFVCGAVVMVFELIGSRVLAPYFGTSLFVWTSIIGVILGSLSLGYYWGGKIADRKVSLKGLSFIVLLAALFIGSTIFVKDFLLYFMKLGETDIKTGSVLASLILFLPTSFLLGMVSPYSLKLRMEKLETSGSTAGNLYALSTSGSIIGTFLSGFYLIPRFGTNKLLIILFVVLIANSLLISYKDLFKRKMALLVMALLGFFMYSPYQMKAEENGFIDIDTAYNRVWIYEFIDQRTSKPVRMMGINNENHSLMYLDSDELANEYAKYYHLAKFFNPGFRKTLMLGGGGYSFPKDFLNKYPEATIDVVEIDPKLTELSRKYFRLKDDPRLSIFHQDGRVFLNRTKEKYDVIFGDAFNSCYSIPYQLTTKEAVEKKYDILNEKGVVLLNIISAIEGDKSGFLKAEYATYKSVFPQVYVFPTAEPSDGEEVQNIMLVALKSPDVPDFRSGGDEFGPYLSFLWKKEIGSEEPILTDDHAPVDHYISKIIL